MKTLWITIFISLNALPARVAETIKAREVITCENEDEAVVLTYDRRKQNLVFNEGPLFRPVSVTPRYESGLLCLNGYYSNIQVELKLPIHTPITDIFTARLIKKRLSLHVNYEANRSFDIDIYLMCIFNDFEDL